MRGRDYRLLNAFDSVRASSNYGLAASPASSTVSAP
jgi:hypothetical protein